MKKLLSTLAEPMSRKPRATAASRKGALLAARSIEQAKDLARQADFLAQRPLLWLEVFSKALRVALIEPHYPDVEVSNSGFYDHFTVDPMAQTVTLDSCNSSIGQIQLSLAMFTQMSEQLDFALACFERHDAAVLAQKVKSQAKELKRQCALSKLTDEDRQALGV